MSEPRHRRDTPPGLDDDDQRQKDTSYSPSSGQETEELQRDGRDSEALDEDVDAAEVITLPGTGGPDDAGDTLAEPGADGRRPAPDPDQT